MRHHQQSLWQSWMSKLPRIFILPLIGALVMSFQLYAQRTVSGTVTDGPSGPPIPGATVAVKGTTTGAITGDDGAFSLRVSGNDAVLIVSYLGFQTQEIAVGSNSTMNIGLVPSDIELDDVVITALGVERETKALGYSVTELDGNDFTQAREINIANSLSGRVAGVNVSGMATGAGGSVRIVLRGNASISGNNQPLIVVDGIPIDNSNLGNAGMWGGADQGDGIGSLNPDDIASISVLKGSSAAALYGSRASNGVILVTTKQGNNRRGVGVEVSSTFTGESVINFNDWQKEFGHGRDGVAPSTQQEALAQGLYSWGGRVGGSAIQFDGETRPYTDQGDNVGAFYNTGTTWTNTLALSGGDQDFNFRVGATRLDNNDVMPNSGLYRNTLTANVGGNFGDKFTARLAGTFSNQNARNRPRLSDSPGNGNYTVGSLPATINVESLKGTTDKLGAGEDGTELQFNDNIFVTNPYWAAYQFNGFDIKDRLIGNLMLRYMPTDWLFVQTRIGMDYYQRRSHFVTPYGTAYQGLGSLSEGERRFREVNMEAILGFDRDFGDIGVNAFVGGNQMRQEIESISISGSNFNIPFFESFSNTANQSGGYGFNTQGINSVFGSVELSYRDFFFLTGTVRNDWFSTLTDPSLIDDPDNSPSILYPSVSASFVLSDALELPSAINFAKVRASWAQVGGATSPYNLLPTFSLVDQGHLGNPLARISQGTVPNSKLQPLTSTEFEVGMDIRLFDGRVGLDVAYYNQQTTNDILNVSISQTSGYGSASQNIGEMSNQGVEALLTLTPVQTSDFRWNLSFNFAYNQNMVDTLAEGLSSIQVGESRTRNAYIQHRTGHPYSAIVGYRYARDEAGQMILDPATGLPTRTSALEILGYGNNPFTGGVLNELSWKGVNLSFLIDFQAGGDIYTATNAYAYFRGLHQATLEGREGGVPVNGVDSEGNPVSMNADAEDYYQRIAFNITEEFVNPADFVKLRQLTLGYSIPRSIMENSSVMLKAIR
ncbi:MAG: SusC/RagA family TonB-linked outer membrane protein [Bacteroidota bacterium]